ncbi:MAG: hypothetical protein ACLP0J_29090 [Solirubrobacteraceae bacterium]
MSKLLATTVLLALLLAACGSSSKSTTSSISSAGAIPVVPTDTPAVQDARLEAAKCMRAQGINIPDLTPGGGRIVAVLRIIASYPTVKVQSAEKACYSSLRQAFPNAFGTDLTPAQLAERRQQGVVFAECMRSHGINYPDPTTAAANPAAAVSQINSLDTSSPAFKAAGTTCKAEALKASG